MGSEKRGRSGGEGERINVKCAEPQRGGDRVAAGEENGREARKLSLQLPQVPADRQVGQHVYKLRSEPFSSLRSLNFSEC